MNTLFWERKFFTNSQGLDNCVIKQIPEDFVVEEFFEKNILSECRFFIKNAKNEIKFLPSRGNYVIGELEKRKIETIVAIEKISKKIKVNVEDISFSGMKDKWAVTCQKICIKDLLKKIKTPIYDENFIFSPKNRSNCSLKIGGLCGNKFTVTIRNIYQDEEYIKNIVKNFEQEAKIGLPNYYGRQRFGGPRSVSHIIGKFIIDDKIKEAINIFLMQSSPVDSEKLRYARKQIEYNQNYKKALSGFPNELFYEKIVIKHLIKKPGDYLGAFEKINANLRRLFVFSYQSYLFNKMLEKRIELLGKKTFQKQEGDIMCDNNIFGMVPGYMSEFSSGIQGEIEKEVLNEHGISFSYFEQAKKYGVNCRGEKRPICMNLCDFNLVSILPDEINIGKNKLVVSFNLKSGQYATVFLEELLKTSLF
ncbi:MAG: tRNA pseudouridine(13) synthase TruD [Candidatus ainarchaeum sp.]|nr:tRNA pseudouridine(13) synthase TruD [Candidatus ainarchaeum sp.]